MPFKVFVDWDNDGIFDDAASDISQDVKSMDWFIGFGDMLSGVADESTATIVLNNTDGKYNPENTSSPLYGDLVPHKRLIIEHVLATNTRMWTGFIASITPGWAPAGSQTGEITATITATGIKMLLDAADAILPAYENVRTDEVIADVLARTVQPPSTGQNWVVGVAGFTELGETTILNSAAGIIGNLNTGDITIETYTTSGDKSASDVIREMVAAEYGRFWINRDGEAEFRARRSRVSNNTGDIGVYLRTGQYAATSAEYVHADKLSTAVVVTASPTQTSAAPETLWQYDGEPITLAPGEVYAIRAQLRKNNGQFAGGSNVSGAATWQRGDGTLGVETDGGVSRIEIKADAGIGGVLETITLTGNSTVQQNNVEIERLDSAAVAIYGRRQYSYDAGPTSDLRNVSDLGGHLVTLLSTPFARFSKIGYRRLDDSVDNAHMLEWTVNYSLRVVEETLGHDAWYRIISERHMWQPGGPHIAEYGLAYEEGANHTNYWKLGFTGLTELGVTTRAGL